jgi:hypothetical protein
MRGSIPLRGTQWQILPKSKHLKGRLASSGRFFILAKRQFFLNGKASAELRNTSNALSPPDGLKFLDPFLLIGLKEREKNNR